MRTIFHPRPVLPVCLSVTCNSSPYFFTGSICFYFVALFSLSLRIRILFIYPCERVMLRLVDPRLLKGVLCYCIYLALLVKAALRCVCRVLSQAVDRQRVRVWRLKVFESEKETDSLQRCFWERDRRLWLRWDSTFAPVTGSWNWTQRRQRCFCPCAGNKLGLKGGKRKRF